MGLNYDRQLVDDFLHREKVQGVHELGGFAYRLDLSVPAVATAIHAGHNVREELLPLMALDEAGRLFEEDAATEEMIQGAPSAIWGLDSRAVYDLNRPPENALPLTPEQFWGTCVYRDQPSGAMNAASMARFEAFHRFLASWLQALIERYGACVVYDIHSYNITRQLEKGIPDPPVFNLGTRLLDMKTWGDAIEHWLELLGGVNVPGREVTVEVNKVFFGRAYLTASLTRADDRILVLPTEISKIYMKELEGVLIPDVVQALKTGLGKAFAHHTCQFADAFKYRPCQN